MFQTTPPKDVMNIKPFTPSGRMAPTFQLLSQREIQDYYQGIIDKWEPLSDVWAVRVAPVCTTVAVAVSGFCVNHIFRQKFNIRDVGLVWSFLGTGAMSSLVFGLVDRLTRRSILDNDYCPVCIHARHAIVYPTFGLVFPLITSPAINLHYAGTAGFDVPQLHELRKVRKLWWSIVKPAIPTLSLMCGALMALGIFMSYQTMENIHWVHYVIARMHEDYLKQYDALVDKREKKIEDSAQ